MGETVEGATDARDDAKWGVGLAAPAAEAMAVSPGDDPLPVICRGLYVGTGGSIVVELASGAVATFQGVPAGSLLPVQVRRVLASGTTAGDLVALGDPKGKAGSEAAKQSTAWLVEHGPMNAPAYLKFRDVGAGWTKDPFEAVRFQLERDAAAVAGVFGPKGVRVAQHAFDG